MRIEQAALRAGRDPRAVRLVAVSKYATADALKELLESGEVSELGESRVQDASRKKDALGALARRARWRMIGHLQRNKSRPAIEVFDALDSLDNLELARKLDRELADAGRTLSVLVQVKLADRETQSGVEPEGLSAFLTELKACPRLTVDGLMAIAPNLEPAAETRPYFRRMRELFERFFSGRAEARLSMGMSRDYEIAVEEGANQVRVGSAIFSECMHLGRVIHDR